ncbi:GNAT family N-acetyltransferase [bacterium]|nr:GNAT family N-acetyltransferase [bacterium]
MIQVKSLLSLGTAADKGKLWSRVEAIFFESSVKKTFASAEERDAFRFKYLDWYAKKHSECFFLAVDPDLKVLGYICGSPQTLSAPELAVLHPWFSLFASEFAEFPAHLHINCSESARGKGIGSTLLNVFENYLRSMSVAGVHLVTAPDARNVGFYEKNGYEFTKTAEWKTSQLFLMGKKL